MLTLQQQELLWHWLQTHFSYQENDWQILYLNHQPLGRIGEKWAFHLRRDAKSFISYHAQGLSVVCDDWYQLGELLQNIAKKWHDLQLYSGWRDEKQDVLGGDGQVLFTLERSAFRPFGLYSQAVHVNGFSETEHGRMYWIGKRSPYKSVDANKLDNITGGGISAGEMPAQAMQRELWEEAGLKSHQFQIVAQDKCLSVHTSLRGLHREKLHIYDICLDENIEPHNQDGEVAAFIRLNLNEVVQALIQSKLTNDASLVMLNHFYRNRWLDKHSLLNAYFKNIKH